jgi:hypothetical protein
MSSIIEGYNMIKSLFQVFLAVGFFLIVEPTFAFEAMFVTKDQCASENGKQLGLVFSEKDASTLISDGYIRNTMKCVKEHVPSSVDDDGCSEYEVTGEIRNAAVRLGTLEYVLVSPRSHQTETLAKGGIAGWLSATHDDTSGQDWSDVKWSFDPSRSLATMALLPKGPYNDNPTSLYAWLFDNIGKRSNEPLTQFLKSNSFELENSCSGESLTQLGSEFSSKLLEDIFRDQSEINIYVENCGRVVTAFRK